MPSTTFRRRGVRVLAGAAVLALAGTSAAYAGLTDPGGANRHDSDQTSDIAGLIKHGKAKNVILFIGDGMGDSEITVARNYLVGAAGRLQGIDSLPLTGQYTTYALHKGDDPLSPGDDTGKPDYVTDSAASGTGWSTGVKTYNGAISVGLNGTTTHQTLLEWAKTKGLKTGDITTAEVQDATPAVQVSHVADRGCYTPLGQTVTVDGRSQKKDTTKCPGQTSIEEQILTTRADVVMGGGRGWYDAQATNGKSVYQNALDAGFQVPQTKAQLDAITTANQTTPVLGLFASGNMQTRYKATPATATGYAQPATTCQVNTTAPDGSTVTWPGTQPTLADMTDKAIKLLDNKKGFFLQVEGASIDKQDHAANACGQIGETQDLDDAVKVGMAFAKTHGDTLVIVTADHAHTSQIINAADISASSPNTIPLAGTFNLLTADGTVETVAYGTAQLAGSQQHTGTQLRIAGYGPGAANVVGLSDQTDLFTTIKGALSGIGLDTAPTPPGSKACAHAPTIVKNLKAELAKAKRHHQHAKVANLEGRIAGVRSLARLC